MALTVQDRQRISAALQREWSDAPLSCALTKADLLAAIGAVDDWIDANAVAFNQSLPAAVRTGLSPVQKADVLYAVAVRRSGRRPQRDE